MDKPLKLYEVSRFNSSTAHFYAKDSGAAKRAYCKLYGLHFNDPWCGASTLSARAMKPAEAAEWEAQAESRHATYVFIKGMMELYTKAYKDSSTGQGHEGTIYAFNVQTVIAVFADGMIVAQ